MGTQAHGFENVKWAMDVLNGLLKHMVMLEHVGAFCNEIMEYGHAHGACDHSSVLLLMVVMGSCFVYFRHTGFGLSWGSSSGGIEHECVPSSRTSHTW